MKSFLILFAFFLTASAQGIATYEEIKDLPNRPEILLIDVREPFEIEQTGIIPTAINIPCKKNNQGFLIRYIFRRVFSIYLIFSQHF